MDVASSSSHSTLQTVKERMREKINGSLKAVRLQASLAAKIKTKTLNNSSIVKVSLKHNNKALACALTVEREKSRRLENDKMFLQKEVKMLHFQNALLRQNLSIVNKMLKDIDLFMNINLPAAIEISSIMESSDLLSEERKSERFSHQSTISLNEDQGFRLTGVALRVPASSVEQRKHNSVPAAVLSNDNHHVVLPSTNSESFVREKSDGQGDTELHTLTLTSKESLLTDNENKSQDCSSNSKVSDAVLQLDEVLPSSSRKAQSGGFVTKRKKRSTIFRSSAQSVKSDANQSKGSIGARSESCHSTQWEMDATILPDSVNTGFCGEIGSSSDFVKGRNRPSTVSCSFSQFEKLDIDQNCDAKKESCNLTQEQVAETTNQPELVCFGERDQPPVVDGCIEQEETVYEADMEITSSDAAAIVAVVSNKKKNSVKSKSSIPIKQDGTSLRKVRQSAREKTTKKGSYVEEKITNSSESKERTGTAVEFNENVTLEIKVSADPNPAGLSDKYDNRRTYILPGPVKQENIDDLESATKTDPVMEMSTSTQSAEKVLSDNITAVNSGRKKLTFTLENKDCTEIDHNTTDTTPNKKKSKNSKGASKNKERSRKKKQTIHTNSKDQEPLGEDKGNNVNESSEQLDNTQKIDDAIPNFRIKNRKHQIRRETYVVSATKPLPMATEFISKDYQIHYRRETFVIPEPNPLVSIAYKTSISEEKTETFVKPLNVLKSVVHSDICPETENGSETKKTDSKKVRFSSVSDADYDKSDKYNWMENFDCPERKGSSSLSSQLNKRKTHILPAKEDDLGHNKDILVRESVANLTSSQTNKPTKMLNTIVTNKHDSFMLDMVSESILDETLECPSFVEFPSATNPESTFTVDVSLNTVPPLELPAPSDCNTKELSHVPNTFNVLDENDNGQDMLETESDPQCKNENQSMEIQDTAIKPFQDLTNKMCDSIKQSPKSCSEEDDSKSQSRRRRNPVNYREPNLSKKLRR